MDKVAEDSHFGFYNVFWVNCPWKQFLKNKIKSLVNFGWNGGYLQISPILTIAIPSPFSYQGHFKFSGWPNKWNLNGFGCLFESCPRAGENKCSVLPGGSSGSPSLLEFTPLPFPHSCPNKQSEWARKRLCDCYLMMSLLMTPSRDQDAVVRPLLKKSLFYVVCLLCCSYKFAIKIH